MRRWVCLIILSAFAAAGSPQTPEKNPLEQRRAEVQSERIVRQWRARLKIIESQVTAGESKKAYRNARNLADEMMDSIRSGEDTGMALAFAIVLRAVAAAQLGQESEAIWHWHVALQLFPDIDRLDLEPYGAAGALLRANPARGSQQHGESSPKKDEVVLDLEKGEIKPPKKIRTPNPRFPRAKYGEGKRVEISVQFIIDKSGTPHGPRIIESRGELTMVYSALETMRSWKFAPARQAGEPISVYYMMTVNYISG